jgi:hypothetical protein
MVVATHNPSNLALQIVEIKVPHANFNVRILKDMEWSDAEADVACNI